MSPDAPNLGLRRGKKNLMLSSERDPHYDPNATWVAKHGDVDRDFRKPTSLRSSLTLSPAPPLFPCSP